jgi:hypothetical protein
MTRYEIWKIERGHKRALFALMRNRSDLHGWQQVVAGTLETIVKMQSELEDIERMLEAARGHQ